MMLNPVNTVTLGRPRAAGTSLARPPRGPLHGLKTDSLNERSRRAILRLGAIEEGTLRKHMVTDSGRIRHTVYYSIIDDEWPAVKARLEGMLATR